MSATAGPPGLVAAWSDHLSAINAALNATSATLVVLGFVAIRRHRRELHARLMVSAIVASSLFLVGYLLNLALHGTTRFPHQGLIRTVYFTILLTHTVLAVAVPPLVGFTVWFAWRGRLARHKRLARWTLPIWAYVSVTGVVIYLLLHHLPPTP